MNKNSLGHPVKRDHTIVARDFFGPGKNLERWQLGWSVDNRIEAKTSVSRKIFEYYVEDGGFNIVFFYLGDGRFYGIHAEECPTPVFRFKKEEAEYLYDQLGNQDTHDYDDGEILYNVPCDKKIWNVVRIDGKSLEEVLQNSYIVNIS